jgi:hypothetical protein
MIEVITKVLRDTHTGKDNVTYDWVKCWGSVSTVIYCLNSLVDTILQHMFAFSSFAGGISIMFAAICGGALIKKDTEPKERKNDTDE